MSNSFPIPAIIGQQLLSSLRKIVSCLSLYPCAICSSGPDRGDESTPDGSQWRLNLHLLRFHICPHKVALKDITTGFHRDFLQCKSKWELSTQTPFNWSISLRRAFVAVISCHSQCKEGLWKRLFTLILRLRGNLETLTLTLCTVGEDCSNQRKPTNNHREKGASVVVFGPPIGVKPRTFLLPGHHVSPCIIL